MLSTPYTHIFSLSVHDKPTHTFQMSQTEQLFQDYSHQKRICVLKFTKTNRITKFTNQTSKAFKTHRTSLRALSPSLFKLLYIFDVKPLPKANLQLSAFLTIFMRLVCFELHSSHTNHPSLTQQNISSQCSYIYSIYYDIQMHILDKCFIQQTKTLRRVPYIYIYMDVLIVLCAL